MIRREARLDNPPPETATPHSRRRSAVVIRSWERPVLLVAVILILMVGAIASMNGLISLFP